jgi:hypothetical protein
MVSKGKLAVRLASVGVAAAAVFPASAGAQECVTECGGGTGLTTGLVAIASSPGADTTGGQLAEAIISDRLAGNHNETVLSLA